jgi:hypothetical protein
MKSKFLFPAWYSIVGYLLTVPGFILGYLYEFNDYKIPGFGFEMRKSSDLILNKFENFTNELAVFLVIIGLIFIAFSKRKKEDELSAKLRLNALYWSIMFYYIVYLIGYIYTMIGEIPIIEEHFSTINLFTPLIIFIVRYHYLLAINKDSYLVPKLKFLPYKPFKQLSMALSILSFIVLGIFLLKDMESAWFTPFTNVLYFVMISSTLAWAFSKNKIEDELTMQLRLESLQMAVYFNYAIILIATLVFYSIDYLVVLLIAQFSVLFFFVIRMEYINYKNNHLLKTVEGRFES